MRVDKQTDSMAIWCMATSCKRRDSILTSPNALKAYSGKSYSHFEYILVNNCSTDGSGEIAQTHVRRESRIRLIRRWRLLSQLQNCDGALVEISMEAFVSELVRRECEAGLHRLEIYADFADRVRATKRNLPSFLIEAKSCSKSLAGYGAPGEDTMLLNYCGIRADFLDYIVDRNPYKHGKYLPGTHIIPFFPPEKIFETKPDYVVILPWNLKDEIVSQLAAIRTWGAKFVVPIPEVSVI
jgi:C-methyltransferase C-terminal domain/Glycosyl transferase family 2